MVDRWTRSPENRRLLSLPLRPVINLSEAVSKSLRNSYRSPARRISLSPDTASLSVSVANQTDGRNYYISLHRSFLFLVARLAGANCFQHRSTDSTMDKWIPYLVIQFYRLSNCSLSLGYLIIFHSTRSTRGSMILLHREYAKARESKTWYFIGGRSFRRDEWLVNTNNGRGRDFSRVRVAALLNVPPRNTAARADDTPRQ